MDVKKPATPAADDKAKLEGALDKRSLNRFWRTIFVVFPAIGIFLTINDVFNLNFLNITIMTNSLLYLLIGCFVSLVFILYPVKLGLDKGIFYIIDILLFAATAGISGYLALHGLDIVYKGWSAMAPFDMQVLSIILWILILEALRRSAGLVISIVVLVFSLYPLFAEYMPGPLNGIGFSFTRTATFHALGEQSLLGIPMQVLGDLVLGFIVYGVALQSTGGGKCFLDLATGLFGHVRGGPAKVAIVASALFGSMSGSVPANVVTTGNFTIPIIKKTGYPPRYAGAIEACSSTGGVIMPPIMGATAFIMASFLGVPYLDVVKAAIIPSLLYYLSLLVNVDCYAACNNLSGMPKDEIPSLKKTLKEGWYYFFSLLLLIGLLIYRLEAQAPFYATAFILLVTNIRKETRLNFKKVIEFFAQSGKLLAGLATIFAAVGMIIGSMSITGVGHSLSRELVAIAGGNVFYLLLMGAFASFILGMGMTMTACYIFLAVVLAPGLTQAGFDPMAVHFYVLYCAMLSYITPPVAIAAFTAAPLAGAPPMKVGLTATKLAAISYVIPFLLVIHPALVGKGSFSEIAIKIFICLIGVWLMGGGLGKYLVGLGPVSVGNLNLARVLRVGYLVGGVTLMLQIDNLIYVGLVISIATVLLHLWQKRRAVTVAA